MKLACVQMTSTRDPASNLVVMEAALRDAVARGAAFVAFPETCNFMERGAQAMRVRVACEAEDGVVVAMMALAEALGVWVSLGSVIVTDGAGAPVNRALLINPEGVIVARYDKIHMFDVELANGEQHTESAHYRAGTQAVVASVGDGVLGLTICYDVRFPALYRALAEAGADFIVVPSAFTVPTGAAHWHILLRARAIETGCFIVAAAQCGAHQNGRKTYGHSLIIDPWGQILAEAKADDRLILADMDLAEVGKARAQIPALRHARPFQLPPALSKSRII